MDKQIEVDNRTLVSVDEVVAVFRDGWSIRAICADGKEVVKELGLYQITKKEDDAFVAKFGKRLEQIEDCDFYVDSAFVRGVTLDEKPDTHGFVVYITVANGIFPVKTFVDVGGAFQFACGLKKQFNF